MRGNHAIQLAFQAPITPLRRRTLLPVKQPAFPLNYSLEYAIAGDYVSEVPPDLAGATPLCVFAGQQDFLAGQRASDWNRVAFGICSLDLVTELNHRGFGRPVEVNQSDAPPETPPPTLHQRYMKELA
jgi:hypothetical protein